MPTGPPFTLCSMNAFTASARCCVQSASSIGGTRTSGRWYLMVPYPMSRRTESLFSVACLKYQSRTHLLAIIPKSNAHPLARSPPLHRHGQTGETLSSPGVNHHRGTHNRHFFNSRNCGLTSANALVWTAVLFGCPICQRIHLLFALSEEVWFEGSALLFSGPDYRGYSALG
jgi:hypothetical protein